MARDCDQNIDAAQECVIEIGLDAQRLRKRRVGQIAAIAPVALKRRKMTGVTTPEPHLMSSSRELDCKRSAP